MLSWTRRLWLNVLMENLISIHLIIFNQGDVNDLAGETLEGQRGR